MFKMCVAGRLSRSHVLIAATLLGIQPFQLAHAQTLYVISGTPTNTGPESIPVLLYSVIEGKPHLESTLVPRGDGLFSVLDDLNGNYAILSPHGLPSSVSVLRTKPALSSSLYPISEAAIGELAESLLILRETSLTRLAVPLRGNKPANEASVEMIPLSMKGEAKTAPLSSIDYGQFIFAGVPGGPEGGFTPVGRIVKGRLVLPIGGSSKELLDLPPLLQTDHGGQQVSVLAASAHYVVLCLPQSRSDLASQHGETFTTLFIKDRLLNKWLDYRLKGNVSRSRLFGDWLASIQESWHSDNVSNPGRDNESPDVAARFKYGEGGLADIPGILLLDNLATASHMQIRTGEEDSEILNIMGNRICYRVNDSVFEATIAKDGIKDERRIARAPELQSVHWAFWE
jgi:hypothetical protein